MPEVTMTSEQYNLVCQIVKEQLEDYFVEELLYEVYDHIKLALADNITVED